ncbi:MAG TPA: alpha-amylase [Firmicutes bacterium]|nr:alpha-amylase [Bacillota bacterium]
MVACFVLLLVGCSNEVSDSSQLSDDGVYYEIFVRAFADSDGDGIGDFNGITENLDYLEDLGIKGIWLMPINPSPSYHGYDVTDYYDVNADYGTLDDFKNLIKEANDRGIKIVMDLVLNHASSEHPWFVESKEDASSPYADYFVWADADDTSYDFSASPIDGKAWHSWSSRKYFGAFWDGMPDWNASNQKVRDEFIKIGKFWLDLGVDGFRLDAAKYMYAQGEYNTELNLLQENLDFWQEITDGWREVNDDVYIVGEVWSSSSSVAPYYMSFTSNFDFDLADEIISAVRNQKDTHGFGLMKNYQRTLENYAKYAPNGDVFDATFLSNHDQDRIMSVFGSDTTLMKMAAEIYLMLPGNPYIYYGEELGMLGRKPDEDIRLPFKWGNEFETTWRADPYNNDLSDVQAQKEDSNSLYNHYKTLIAVRNESTALSSGDFLAVEFNKSFMVGQIRYTLDEAVLVAHNVSDRDLEISIQATEGDILYSSNDGASINNDTILVPSSTTLILTIPADELQDYTTINIK